MSGRRRQDGGRDQGRKDARGGSKPDPWGVGADPWQAESNASDPGDGNGNAGDDYRDTDYRDTDYRNGDYRNSDYRDGDYRDPGTADQGNGPSSAASFQPRSGGTGQVYIAPTSSSGQDYEDSGYRTARYDARTGYDAGREYGGRDSANGYGAPAGSAKSSADGYGAQAGATETRAGNGYSATSAYPGNGRQESAHGPAGGYGAAGYAGGYGGTDQGGGYDAAGYSAGDSGPAATSFIPEFMPVDDGDSANDGSLGTPRPIGRLSIFTLLDDKAREFDRLAERAAEGVRTAEPDTYVFVIHVVPKAPLQRIIYEVYRDRAAFESHERQPHIQRFLADRAAYVLATNIIDLRLKYAKVAALGSPAAAEPHEQPQYQATQSPRGPRALEQVTGSAPRAQFPTAQASFTPAEDRNAASSGQYSAGNGQYAAASEQAASGQYAATDRGQYPATGQYSPTGQYAANGQYGYSGDGRYSANGNGQYPAANGYPDVSEYPASSEYSPSNGYSASNEHSDASGYSGANGYSGATGYQAANGYAGTSGYRGANGYPDTSGYPGASAYPDAGYPDAGTAAYAPPATDQYPDPAGRTSANGGSRYRELGSGPEQPAVGAGDYADDRNAAGGQTGRGKHGPRSESADWEPPRNNEQRYGAR